MSARIALLVFALLTWPPHARAAAAAPREVHGMADTYAIPGVTLAWAVLRGTTETTTSVTIRIAADPARYPFVAVTGVDPFTQQAKPVLAATVSDARNKMLFGMERMVGCVEAHEYT